MTPPNSTLLVAAAQIVSGPDPVANLATAIESVRRAAAAGAQLVVLPEATMACFGTDLGAVAEPLDGPWVSALRQCATDLDVTVVAGMFEPADDGRVHNTLLVAGRDVDTSYRKIHLYDAFGSRESDLVAPGNRHVVVTVRGVRVGMATCYDLRFADQFTALGRAGAELVVVPASWGDGPGKSEQWDLLTRARATDAQAWLLAADQAWVPPRGTDPLGVGRSVLVDPLGRVRVMLGHEAALLTTEIDLTFVQQVRKRIPVL